MSAKLFKQEITVGFRQADPAGILFFANVFPLAHDVYENFVTNLGMKWDDWFNNAEWAVPIRHTEADFLLPMRPSETYQVTVSVEQIGESSFTLKYLFSKAERLHCEVKTVHTFLRKKAKAKIPIPADVRLRLEAYQR